MPYDHILFSFGASVVVSRVARFAFAQLRQLQFSRDLRFLGLIFDVVGDSVGFSRDVWEVFGLGLYAF
ncbi:hypothetical protein L1987_71846 [Smallanthus sonchifolius]|uniref:Uncharacterized protein n=1 Tax=Smallanthus sonchifolius TaxID=185202 RepID=A0ACB9ASS2_9ASTR|nr:hypothetical protein L1987_71846 [Smallanthus sonchifolius]